jgi:hypothetical protein
MFLVILYSLLTYCEYQRSWLVTGLYNWDFEVKDTLLFANSAYGADIINIARSDNPRLISSIMTPGLSFDLAVSENRLYICDDYTGVRIFDITNVSNPVELGYIDTPGLATKIFIKDTLAYVADDWNGLRIIDVSEPTNPVELGFYDTPGRAIWIEVVDTLAYVSDYINGLLIINVKNPVNPQLIGEWNDSVAYVWTVDVRDTLAYVSGMYLTGGILKNFMVLNVSNPSSPFYISGLSLPEPPHAFVIKDDTIAFVNAQNSGIRIINIKNPFNFYEITSIPGNYLNSFTIADSLLFAPYHLGTSIIIYNVSNLSNIQPIGEFTPGPYVEKVVVEDDNLFVTTWRDYTTVWAFDCAIPDSIILTDSLLLSPGMGVLFYETPYLYVGHGANLSIFRFSNGVLEHISTTPGGFTNDIEKKNNSIFCGGSSLRIYDVSNPSMPQLISSLNVPCSRMVLYDTLIFAISVSGNFLYVINVADLQSPFIACSLYTQHYTKSLTLSYPYLFIGNDDCWLQVVDISDPMHPQIVNAIYTPYCYNEDIIVQDTLLYVAGNYRWGLKIFNISNPVIPQLIDSCDTPGWTYQLSIKGDYIYCADEVCLGLIKFSGTSVSERRQRDSKYGFIAYPNPFKKEVKFYTTLEERNSDGSPIMLRIYDCTGRLIDELHSEYGNYYLWDGRDSDGKFVPPGVYFARLTSLHQVITRKIVKIN